MARNSYPDSSIPWISVSIAVMLLVLFGLSGYIVLVVEPKQERIMANDVRQAWASWTVWRDQNCKLSEKEYGVQVGLGKGSYRDNAITYSCVGDVKYVINDSVGRAVQSCLPENARCRTGVGMIPVVGK